MTEEQKLVYNGLMDFYESHKSSRFIPRQMVEHMEPIFRAAGLREEVELGNQHILVARDDAAGDFVMMSPFLRELRRIYPTAHISFYGSDRNEELARCCPYIDTLMIKNLEKEIGLFWELYPFMVKQAVECFVPYRYDLGFAGRLGVKAASMLMMYMGGVKRRVAYTQIRPGIDGRKVDTGWNALLTLPVPILPILQSDADRDLFLLEYMLQLPIADRHLELWTLSSEREAAVQALAPLTSKKHIKRLYTVMPCASERFREWPAERWVELLKIITDKEKDVGLVLMGGKEDVATAEAVARAFPARAISLAGRLPFRVSAEVVGLTEKYLGEDTSLMHFAAAKGVPVLANFPYPADMDLHYMSIPVRFQPYQVPAVIVLPAKAAGPECNARTGTGCSVRTGPHCILNITVKKMLEGYMHLNRCIAENRRIPMVLK